MSQITSHVLDTSRGRPAQGLSISLFRQIDEGWQKIAEEKTNTDGRVSTLCSAHQALCAGTYRMHFDTAPYFRDMGEPVFYPWVDVVFCINGDGQYYHIPLLISPFAYSTYRGS